MNRSDGEFHLKEVGVAGVVETVNGLFFTGSGIGDFFPVPRLDFRRSDGDSHGGIRKDLSGKQIVFARRNIEFSGKGSVAGNRFQIGVGGRPAGNLDPVRGNQGHGQHKQQNS
ncbi:hypothetical protein SDC9_170808 [bioreactor metagenome]|uniref:Uncharacterized protein n=1 Tax=bioreactor metagenome TaxID=1076179 RepID=A0A645GBJ4_9ZZZZ